MFIIPHLSMPLREPTLGSIEDARSLMDAPKVEELLVNVALSPALDCEGSLSVAMLSVVFQVGKIALTLKALDVDFHDQLLLATSDEGTPQRAHIEVVASVSNFDVLMAGDLVVGGVESNPSGSSRVDF